MPYSPGKTRGSDLKSIPRQTWSCFLIWLSVGENISLGPKEDRLLITGLHSVKDIRCNVCTQVVGWKYINNRTLLFKVFAFEESQKYKEGKYIVESAMITKENQWDEA
ncbi:3464_t:CDS:2 [Paraglomus brasilianum]|uniref:3464_t:CDS:1 n=1 Tax=Paraglomus brasilianum TaxID=144538 RepID=A0A9N8ZBD2_9GLOM|nr:3464_t:CDS:2 [Paraglomus brasilianum]